MSSFSGSSRRIHPESLKVDAAAHPGWLTGAQRTPVLGDVVYCTEGMGQVVRVLGRTQDGSRLLELHLADGRREAFFAAASNVLVPAAPASVS